MNAYELAEIVDKWAYSESAEYLTDAANMLRQQADRIAELEKQSEPVAWMFQGAFDISTYVSFDKPNPDIYPNPKPLYTTPQTKPLSDEEIEQCFEDACTDFKLLENGKTKGIVNIIDVGRAIEAKVRGLNES